MNALGPVLALFWQAEPRRLLLGGVLSVMTLLAGAVLLGLSGWFITASALAGATAASALVFDVFRPAAAIRALALIRTAGRYGERLVTHDATLGVLATLRVRLFRGWAGPDAARSLIARPARLLHRLTCDVDALDGLYLRILLPLSGAAATWIVIGLMFGFTATVLAMPLVVLVAAAAGVTVWATRASAREARLRAHAAEAHRVRIADLLGGQADWIMAGRLPARRAGVLDAEARLGQAEDRLHRIETRAALGFGVLATLVLATTLLIAGMLADAGEIPAPMAVLAVLLAFAAAEPLGLLRRLGGELGRTLLAARRIGPRLQAADVPRREHPAPRSGLAVELRGVSVGHPGMDLPAVQDVSLAIAQRERVALIGPSGAGKSTLLALLAGELAATGGDVAALPAALMPQRTELFHDTVEGNLRLAAPGASAEAVRSCLADAGLPVDPDALLGEGGAGLSTGQARRLVLARHLLRDAPLWLLDEPTDGLEDALGRDILGRIATLGGPRTLVISTHLRREAALADRLVVISGGRITASHQRGEAGFDAALATLRDG